jgi:hypothetical protein
MTHSDNAGSVSDDEVRDAVRESRLKGVRTRVTESDKMRELRLSFGKRSKGEWAGEAIVLGLLLVGAISTVRTSSRLVRGSVRATGSAVRKIRSGRS